MELRPKKSPQLPLLLAELLAYRPEAATERAVAELKDGQSLLPMPNTKSAVTNEER